MMLKPRGGMAIYGFRNKSLVMEQSLYGSQRTVLIKCRVGLSAWGKKGIRNQPSMYLETVGDQAPSLV